MNCANVIAVATGIVEYNYSALFHNYGGPVVSWRTVVYHM